ncbi:conserved hypothetical protein [Candida dubliniensis CD36]|uniref:DNA/RNA-binding protein Alba-like domain-containing protein n=1 Tax=Candida dubliniensis (strain CD36 / ATCC MYA-646 / CBS 7987 / NCPF 3949 / NRRL Y-17841) TaxID=573826 RepID=B9WJC3_CANDC|nr:conserved hypothetical protein [Candida dubliniensis CD36]CAX41346.1 conserved hypothetical protein [Candida dubliniensis CD36]
MVQSTLKSDYNKQSNSVFNELSKQLTEKEDITVFKITKNDSIRSKVDAILKSIEQDKLIFLSGSSNSIAKLICITEIVKQKQNGQQDPSEKLDQYNKLLHIDSTVNPNYKPISEKENEQTDRNQLEKEALQEIKGPKIYTLPVLYILIGKHSIMSNIELVSWTKQDK